MDAPNMAHEYARAHHLLFSAVNKELQDKIMIAKADPHYKDKDVDIFVRAVIELAETPIKKPQSPKPKQLKDADIK